MHSTSSQPLIITLASKNEGKRRELCHWLDHSDLPIRIELNEQADDVAETGYTFLENARLKAEQTSPVVSNGYVLAEDSGLVVEALEGRYGIRPFPGLFSNRWLTPQIRDELLGQSFPNRMPLDRTSHSGISNSDLCQGILKLMDGQTNRAARYCCGMVLWHPVRGVCVEVLEFTELKIIEGEPRGANGFGYDPITVPVFEDGGVSPHTMAELSTEEKNRISHRGRAFQAVLAYLRAQ